MKLLVKSILLCFILASFAPQDRNLFQREAIMIQLFKHLVKPNDFKPFPNYNDSLQWINLDDTLRYRLINEGEKALEKRWEILTATEYRTFRTHGNVINFQKKYFSRRDQLSDLIIAELTERKGRFMNKIADGIWLICEESTWVVPAHSGGKLHYGESDFYVDLFASETSSLLAWTYYLIGNELDKISPQYTKRIKAECKKRIILPNLTHDEFPWMGFKYKQVNNWNTWITSNWLTTVLILEEDSTIRRKSIQKILRCIDNFVNIQPEDGGCEEGPVYWTVAGGRLLQSLDLLNHATNGQFNINNEELIKNITSFFYNTHIAKNYFVNIGDGPYIMKDRAVKVFHFGKIQNNYQLMSTAKSVAGYYDPIDEIKWNKFGDMYGNLVGIFNYDDFKKFSVINSVKEDIWYPDLQLLCARMKVNQSDYFLSVLGAHNGQSHNHNDVGNYTIFINGEPVIIDIGVETYSAKTFSSKRYEIFTMQSDYHNLPTINGIQQKNGRQYKATNVSYNKKQLSMNIATAYPQEAKVKSWLRTFFYSIQGISIRDQYQLYEWITPVILNHISPLTIKEEVKGIISLYRNYKKVVNIIYDSKKLFLTVNELKLTDVKLQKEWNQDVLYRFQLKVLNNKLKEQITIRYE